MVLLGPEENRYWCLEPPVNAKGAPAKAGARLAKGPALRKAAFAPFAAGPAGLVSPVGNDVRSAPVCRGRLARASRWCKSPITGDTLKLQENRGGDGGIRTQIGRAHV